MKVWKVHFCKVLERESWADGYTYEACIITEWVLVWWITYHLPIYVVKLSGCIHTHFGIVVIHNTTTLSLHKAYKPDKKWSTLICSIGYNPHTDQI